MTEDDDPTLARSTQLFTFGVDDLPIETINFARLPVALRIDVLGLMNSTPMCAGTFCRDVQDGDVLFVTLEPSWVELFSRLVLFDGAHR